ncbi:ribosomal protein L49/IMG2 [Akanthomyces lecanii RCEF 1005]|uniref:Large ribosomal subunit protein mL49 n=1 Tax=Akanthomyces lecanii RCEF 1005 TaxID=1081108 RepID=A0A169YHS7_CORDF|nr:ribosomal protein L49/IMG2 [Akanthomyces lecanii RCEF 1005]
MNSRLSQSLPCARAALSQTLAPRPPPLFRLTPLTSSSSRCLFQQQRNTYATAATAAAAARAAAQRRAPRSFTRAPTPPPTKTAEEQLAGGYLVQRTSSVQLPVYRKLKSGNMREVILIKKVHGDRRRLLEDIKASLAVAADKIRINPTTQHIELQGNYLTQTQKWLLDNGF